MIIVNGCHGYLINSISKPACFEYVRHASVCSPRSSFRPALYSRKGLNGTHLWRPALHVWSLQMVIFKYGGSNGIKLPGQ